MPRALTPPFAYSLPADYIAVPGQPITAASHNDPLVDIQTTLNQTTPIQYGGTAGTSVITAWDGIGAGGSTVPSSGTITLDTATGPWIDISGTTSITAITLGAGKLRIARATGAFQLTASATLVVNGSPSISYTTNVGDLLIIEGYAGEVDVWTIGRNVTDIVRANAFVPGFTTTATAAGTTTLTVSSTQLQEFTGSTTQTVVLPVTSTLSTGFTFDILNKSTGSVTVQSSGANTIAVVRPSQFGTFICALASGTTAASWDANVSAGVVLATQVFTSSGTYTPNANLLYAQIECLGAGGGGGGVAGSISASGGGGGGGAGSLARTLASATSIGTSQSVTIGAAGSGGTAGNNAGSAGGDASVGALCVGKGGSGGSGSSGVSAAGGIGGVPGTGTIVAGAGMSGATSVAAALTTVNGLGGFGGSSAYGGGGIGPSAGGTVGAGGTATGFGGGGGGAASSGSSATAAGGGGTTGLVIIIEYCSR